MGNLLQWKSVRGYNGNDNATIAQTKRSGGAWAGEGFAWRRGPHRPLLHFPFDRVTVTCCPASSSERLVPGSGPIGPRHPPTVVATLGVPPRAAYRGLPICARRRSRCPPASAASAGR